MENDLIRRSALLAKKCVIRGQLDPSSPCPTKVVAIPVDVIERAHSVDAVEVVRCRDCKHWFEKENDQDLFGFCCLHLVWMRSYDFCSCGERKEGTEK